MSPKYVTSSSPKAGVSYPAVMVGGCGVGVNELNRSTSVVKALKDKIYGTRLSKRISCQLQKE